MPIHMTIKTDDEIKNTSLDRRDQGITNLVLMANNEVKRYAMYRKIVTDQHVYDVKHRVIDKHIGDNHMIYNLHSRTVRAILEVKSPVAELIGEVIEGDVEGRRFVSTSDGTEKLWLDEWEEV
jgi:hypothetical protein